MFSKRRMCIFAGLLLLASAGSVCRAQRVVESKRLGNNTEAITAIHSGPLAGSIAIMDGLDVLVVGGQNEQGNTGQALKLFDVLGLGVTLGPRGITYIETQQRFVFDDPSQITTLFLSDNRGFPRGKISVTYPEGFTPDHVEGLAWLPPTSENYPNDILEVAITFGDTSYTSRLEVIDPSGNVVAEIFPKFYFSDPDPFDYITGLALRSPDHILIGTSDGFLWQIDFSGNVLQGPITIPGIADVEGIATLNDRRIAVTSYDNGKLMFLDSHLNVLAGQTLNFRIGFGQTGPNGVAWNSDIGQHLIKFGVSVAPSNAALLVSITPSLNTERVLADLTNAVPAPAGLGPLTYLPDEHRIGISETNCAPNCSIFLYDNTGNLVDQVPVSYGHPALTYIPTVKQFAARRGGNLTTVFFYSRQGELVNFLDLSSTGIDAIRGISFFNPRDPSGGEFLIASSNLQHMLFIVDFTGKLLAQFDYHALGVVDVGDLDFITTGTFAGAFSLLDADTSKIVIFRLPLT